MVRAGVQARARASGTWSGPADVEAKARRLWESGALLRAHAAGEGFPGVDLALRGPTIQQIGDDLGRVQTWVASLESGATRRGRRCYTLVHKPVGGRAVGRNRIPSRAVVATWAEAWTLLGVAAEVAMYDAVLAATTQAEPAVAGPARAWVLAHPLAAIGVAEEWPALLAAATWLRDHRGSGRYLREITAPGVDTKLVERHRGLLAGILGGDARAGAFTASLGLREKPTLLRMRVAFDFMGLGNISEVALRPEELAVAGVSVQRAVIVENEISYLSVPVPSEGVVIWGEGFKVSRAGAMPWLREAQVDYWGDLDTHGFAILDRLRAYLPQTESLLMDRKTLLAHRDRWVREPTPTSAGLSRLRPQEAQVYAALVADDYGPQVRLEQERIDWGWVQEHWPDQ